MKLSVVMSPSKEVAANGTKKVSGQFTISIFVESGAGQTQLATLGSSLDSLFQKKTLLSAVQTRESSLQFLGVDSSDSSLSRADYSVTFSYYGE
jgi:hypothetical protein